MPKISEKYKTLDNGKADLLGADLVDPSFGGAVTLSGGYTTGSIHYQSRASAIFYESTSNGTNFLALRAPLAVTTSRYFSLPDGYPAEATGYFLTSDTSGNMSWAEAGGSTVKISTTTVSTAAANVGITLPTSGYTYLLLHIEGFQPASSGYDLRFYLSDDGGTTTESIYFARGQMTSSWYQQQSSGTRLVLNQSGISNSANAQFRGFIKIHIPTVNSVTSFQWDVGYNLDSSNQNAYYTGVADLVGTGVTANFCKFEMSSGNIAQGVFTLYGIK